MTLYVITGPPAAGKTTYVAQHAKPGDITIDFDAIAATLTPGYNHNPPQHIINIAAAARQTAIEHATRFARTTDVYIIHAMPKPAQQRQYQAQGARIITIDPGRQTCITQATQDKRPPRALQLINQWYNDASTRYATAAAKYVSANW